MRPLNYITGGVTLGHYAVSQRSGTIAATIGAAGHLASVRWADATRLMVLQRIKVGISILSAVTTAIEFTMQAVVVRGFSVDFTTASTAISMTGVTNTNKMRASMGASLLGAVGPRVCTTTVMSGQTLTADAAPFAMTIFPALYASTSTGTAVALPAGAASPMMTLYEWTALGQHPVVLAANEGVVLQPVSACVGSGTFALYTQWEWSEVAVF